MNPFEGAEIVTAVAEAAAPAETKLAEEAVARLATKAGLKRVLGLSATKEGNGVVSFEEETRRLLAKGKEPLKYQPNIKETDFTDPHEARIKELVDKEIGFDLLGRMERGTHGAYMLRDPDGVHHIFKLVSDQDVTPQINISARAAEAVNSLASRTPRYEAVRFTPSHGSWYMQEVLPGMPSPVPSQKLVNQLVQLNDRQAGKAVEGASNWNDRITTALHEDGFGWKKHISGASTDGANLVARVEELTGSHAPEFVHTDDIVHGDFQHFNALVSQTDRLTGYVDWEGAGRGDRTIDLSRLLYDAYVSEAEIRYKPAPTTLATLSNKIADISGPNVLKAEMSYWVLQVANYGAHMGQDHLAMFANVGHKVLNDMFEVAARKSA
ncbi:MAG TPA: phosphotransferase [Oculatellaceae cyanobacterium]